MNYSPNERVQVENTRDWEVSFPSCERPGYGILLKPHVPTRLSFAEVEGQARTPGSFFYGTDGLGAYAPVRIVDDNVRAAIFGEEAASKKSSQVTLELVKDMLRITPNSKFKAVLLNEIRADGDKRMFARLAVKAGLDEVSGGAGKKKIIEEHTGYPVVEVSALDGEPPIVTTSQPGGAIR